MVWHKIWF